MAQILKPDLSSLWASEGARISPSVSKVQLGWTAEIPPHQWENWVQYRQDQMLAHINQRGISQWDALSDYEENISYTQGSNGTVYRSIQSSGPATTVQDPVTDTTNVYWRVAFADGADTYTKSEVDALVADEALIAAIIFG